MVSVSVAVLLPGVGSVTPAGTATVAVFDNVPDAPAVSVALTVYVIVLPAGIVTVSLMLPLPLALKPVAPPLAVAVQVCVASAAGNVSVMVAPVTLLGPLLVATIVYVVLPPALTEVTPSVLVTERSACGAAVSVSLDVSLTPFG